jgi:hypothetical protein
LYPAASLIEISWTVLVARLLLREAQCNLPNLIGVGLIMPGVGGVCLNDWFRTSLSPC